jgi:V/A-type H+-transporting ATPase subunit I
LGEEENGMLVALFGASRDREILERAAHSAYMSPISMPEGYQGTPSSVLRTVQDEIADLLAEQEEASGHVEDLRERWGSTLQRLLRRVRVGLLLLRAMDRYGQVRDVYLVAGWIPEREASDLVSSVQRLTQGRVVADITSADQVGDPSTIPTTLGNRGIIHDFQNLVTTYAFPAYGELDPTPLVALTFVLMFGIMFGDVGHGLVLALLGLAGMKGWVQRLRQLGSLAPILFASGLSAIVFGFLYGSLFGIEDILPTLWIQPLESIMSTLIATVLLGVILSVSGFVLNVINSLRMGDWKRALFGQYGLAGLWFYGSLITLVASVVQGWELPLALIYVNLLLPVILILLGEPLTNLLRKRRPLIHGSKGLYLVTGFFELFEAVISYLSSTLSYVRLGAFAVAHGGLSAVFFILADTVGEPATIAYWAVVLVGNLFIVGFEALVVGIQSLRLEYYEFFSKFFRGGGTPYQPLTLRE